MPRMARVIIPEGVKTWVASPCFWVASPCFSYGPGDALRDGGTAVVVYWSARWAIKKAGSSIAGRLAAGGTAVTAAAAVILMNPATANASSEVDSWARARAHRRRYSESMRCELCMCVEVSELITEGFFDTDLERNKWDWFETSRTTEYPQTRVLSNSMPRAECTKKCQSIAPPVIDEGPHYPHRGTHYRRVYQKYWDNTAEVLYGE